MWITEKIKNDLENIYPQCLNILDCIDIIPHEKAVKIVSYLCEGCFESTNDIWIIICSRLLYQIPEKWIEENIQEILSILNIHWNDDFEFYNLCAIFQHIPNIIEQIIDYSKTKIPEDKSKEWISDICENIGNKEHYQLIFKFFKDINEINLNI